MERAPDYPAGTVADWAAVDGYFGELFVPSDPVLSRTLAANAAAGLPAHDVSPLQGKLLSLLARAAGAKRILEIGTLGGYSTIWLARALPEGGKLFTIERNAIAFHVASQNIANAGLADRVTVLKGKALDVLPHLTPSFDFIFIDADKPNNPAYLRWALSLSKPGTVIVGDNIVRGGAVVDERDRDPRVQGVREFLELMAAEPTLETTAIQTVGEKGWDGFAFAVVRPATVQA